MSIFRRHTNECLSMISSLKVMNCPLELIYLIMRYYWTLKCDPVCILAINNTCTQGNKLRYRWYPRPIGREKPGHSTLGKLQKVCPGLSSYSIIFDRQNSSDIVYREKLRIYPRGINFYAKWSPMILLIPGLSWDTAMVDPDIYANIAGVQVFNGVWKDNEIYYDRQYDLECDDEFVKWFRAASNNREFIAAQNKLL